MIATPSECQSDAGCSGGFHSSFERTREVAHHVVIDQHRLGTDDTTMDDAVADAREAKPASLPR